jgi:hypothetical protein
MAHRFKVVIVQKGEAQLLCSAYIDLNAVRAIIVEKPEDYRWCSLFFIRLSPFFFSEKIKQEKKFCF